MKTTIFPFAAVIGQDSIKKALILNSINPKIGGVLISGEKGTAKSTLVRGLSDIVPDMKIVNLPLNVTEDRLIGNIDFEHAVKYGEKRFEPGLMHRANGGALYVDEVNLLSDHIVKSLLETAASGENIVEREGLSHRHDARFILIGSMNPEEGGLRPQFLDRFGLYVEVESEKDHRKRAEITRRRIDYEKAPAGFCQKWELESQRLHDSIKRAKELLETVTVTENAMRLAASIARESFCAGHRAEIVITETARAIAAYDQRTMISIDDIKEAAKYALPHRARQDNPPPPPPPPPMENEEQVDEPPEDEREQDNQDQREEEQKQDNEQQEDEKPDSEDTPDDPPDESPEDSPETPDSREDWELPENFMPPETVFSMGEAFDVSKWLTGKRGETVKKGSGRRSLVTTNSKHGRYIRYSFPRGDDLSDIALGATLRAAAARPKEKRDDSVAISIDTADIRVKIRERRTGNAIVFVVDASGSMGAKKQMIAVKGAILSLLNDAYQKRDQVGLIAFRNEGAELLLGITRSVELAEKKLAVLPTGGLTPLSLGIELAFETIKAAKVKDKDLLPVIVLVTDGRATFSPRSSNAFDDALLAATKIGAEKIKSVVIDTDRNYVRLNLAEKLAIAMDADLFSIEDIRASSVLAAVSLSL